MTKNPAVAGIDRRTLVSGVAAISAGGALTTAAQAQTKATSPGLSFAVCGDLRPMMYLPYKDGNPDLAPPPPPPPRLSRLLAPPGVVRPSRLRAPPPPLPCPLLLVPSAFPPPPLPSVQHPFTLLAGPPLTYPARRRWREHGRHPTPVAPRPAPNDRRFRPLVSASSLLLPPPPSPPRPPLLASPVAPPSSLPSLRSPLRRPLPL